VRWKKNPNSAAMDAQWRNLFMYVPMLGTIVAD